MDARESQMGVGAGDTSEQVWNKCGLNMTSLLAIADRLFIVWNSLFEQHALMR